MYVTARLLLSMIIYTISRAESRATMFGTECLTLSRSCTVSRAKRRAAVDFTACLLLSMILYTISRAEGGATVFGTE